MRIKENSFGENKSYSPEIREQVKKVFEETLLTLELKRLLGEIKKDSAGLRNLFLDRRRVESKTKRSQFL